MGFATLINLFVAHCVPAWGGRTPYIAAGLWWLDAAVSVMCCLGLPFQMMTTHQTHHETMTAAWLLPDPCREPAKSWVSEARSAVRRYAR